MIWLHWKHLTQLVNTNHSLAAFKSTPFPQAVCFVSCIMSWIDCQQQLFMNGTRALTCLRRNEDGTRAAKITHLHRRTSWEGGERGAAVFPPPPPPLPLSYGNCIIFRPKPSRFGQRQLRENILQSNAVGVNVPTFHVFLCYSTVSLESCYCVPFVSPADRKYCCATKTPLFNRSEQCAPRRLHPVLSSLSF